MPEQGSVEESVFDQVGDSEFAPYDPEAVQPTSSPAPLTQSGDVGDTSGADDTAGENQAQDPQEPTPEFDPRYREPFIGLVYLGALKDTFSLWGHEFVIRTLTTEDLAEVGLLIKQYEGTVAFNAVYQAATVAAAIVTVDDRPISNSLGPNDSGLEGRYRHVMRNYYPPVRQAIWNKYFALEAKVNEVIDAMGKA